MSPCFSTNYVMNSHWFKIIPFSDLTKCHTTIYIELANLFDIIFRQPCSIMRSSISSRLATFFDKVSRVICWGPKKKVLWIDAVTIITRVTNIKTFRDRSFMKFIRKAMTKYTFGVDSNLTISTSACHCPNPATIRSNFIGAIKTLLNCEMLCGFHTPTFINKYVYGQ
jgi:hypothetical protein